MAKYEWSAEGDVVVEGRRAVQKNRGFRVFVYGGETDNFLQVDIDVPKKRLTSSRLIVSGDEVSIRFTGLQIGDNESVVMTALLDIGQRIGISEFGDGVSVTVIA